MRTPNEQETATITEGVFLVLVCYGMFFALLYVDDTISATAYLALAFYGKFLTNRYVNDVVARLKR